MRDEVTWEWRKLHNGVLNYLSSSQNIVRVMKSRRIRWMGHVARMRDVRGVYRVLVGKPNLRKRNHLEEPGVGWDGIKMDIQEVG
jgi:hypothetical protein